MNQEPSSTQALRKIEARCAWIASACLSASWLLILAILGLALFFRPWEGNTPGWVASMLGVLAGFGILFFLLHRLSNRWEYRAEQRRNRWAVILVVWLVLVGGVWSLVGYHALGLLVLIPELAAGLVIVYGFCVALARWKALSSPPAKADSDD